MKFHSFTSVNMLIQTKISKEKKERKKCFVFVNLIVKV